MVIYTSISYNIIIKQKLKSVFDYENLCLFVYVLFGLNWDKMLKKRSSRLNEARLRCINEQPGSSQMKREAVYDLNKEG